MLTKVFMMTCAIACSTVQSRAEERDPKQSIESITGKVSELSTKSLIYSQERRKLAESKERTETEQKRFEALVQMETELARLSAELVQRIQAGKSVFDYPGLLSAGYIHHLRKGYRVSMHGGYESPGDTLEWYSWQHWIYFSDTGIIKEVSRSPEFPD